MEVETKAPPKVLPPLQAADMTSGEGNSYGKYIARAFLIFLVLAGLAWWVMREKTAAASQPEELTETQVSQEFEEAHSYVAKGNSDAATMTAWAAEYRQNPCGAHPGGTYTMVQVYWFLVWVQLLEGPTSQEVMDALCKLQECIGKSNAQKVWALLQTRFPTFQGTTFSCGK